LGVHRGSHWRQNKLADTFAPVLKKHLLDIIQRRWQQYKAAFPLLTITSSAELQTNLFAVETWQAAHWWSVKQAEETYCDLLGLQLFGTAFLEAYAYLLAPKGGTRVPQYPDQRRRVRHLLEAAAALAIDAPPNYDTLFDDNSIPSAHLSTSDAFRLSIADEACDKAVTDLRTAAQDALTTASLRQAANATNAEVQRIVARLRRVVPAEHCTSLADIINAAWVLAHDADLWKDNPELHGNRQQILRELVLKNVEILEIETIQAQPPPAPPPGP
jgi:hypothetical protein